MLNLIAIPIIVSHSDLATGRHVEILVCSGLLSSSLAQHHSTMKYQIHHTLNLAHQIVF